MENKYQRVLVAIDGSSGSDAALKKAVKVARREQAHLDILQVLDLNSLSYDNTGLSLDGKKVYQVEQVNENYLQDLKQQLKYGNHNISLFAIKLFISDSKLQPCFLDCKFT